MKIKKVKKIGKMKIEHNSVLFYIILALILVLAFVVYQIIRLNNEKKAGDIKNDTGQMCGGIAGIICSEGYECNMGGKTYPDASGVCVLKLAIENSCKLDSECVASSCCHSSSCVNKNMAPNCSEIKCTMECKPNTLDCGQGSCSCQNNKCAAVLK